MIVNIRELDEKLCLHKNSKINLAVNMYMSSNRNGCNQNVVMYAKMKHILK